MRSKRTLVGLALLVVAGLTTALSALRLAFPARYEGKTRGVLMSQAQGGVSRAGAVRYSFSVDGQRYTAEGERLDPERVADVWYDPADPRHAALAPERSRRPALVALLAGLACGVAAGWALTRTRAP